MTEEKVGFIYLELPEELLQSSEGSSPFGVPTTKRSYNQLLRQSRFNVQLHYPSKSRLVDQNDTYCIEAHKLSHGCGKEG